jgi:hypothetical protein
MHCNMISETLNNVQPLFILSIVLLRRYQTLLEAAPKVGKEHGMMKSIMMSAILILCVATTASAAGFTSVPIETNSLIVKVAEGCGPGFWRGPQGHCHPMAVGRACPPGYHLGPEGKRCWPN